MISQRPIHGADHPVPRSALIRALARVRAEWEEAAGEDSLIEMQASVGLLLADIARALGLTPLEQIEALGSEMVEELQAL